MAPGEAAAKIPASIRTLRWVVVALLLLSAALTVWGLPELRSAVAAGRWPRAALAIPPTVLSLFVLGYGAYRLALVRAGRYPAGKALTQVGLMLLVLGVVFGLAMERTAPPAPDVPVSLARALGAEEPDVRAMAAELVRHRPRETALPLAPRLVDLLEDPSPTVRREAHASLVALSGTDLGEGPAAVARWRDRFRVAGPPAR
jgi:hypothetical protein